jgi:hypothetical protein
MSKKVSFSTTPTAAKPAVNADEWVQHRNAEATKRLTMDIPASLHTRLKVSCAMRGTTIAEEVRTLLEQHFRNENAAV